MAALHASLLSLRKLPSLTQKEGDEAVDPLRKPCPTRGQKDCLKTLAYDFPSYRKIDKSILE